MLNLFASVISCAPRISHHSSNHISGLHFIEKGIRHDTEEQDFGTRQTLLSPKG
jgi:hypothetical protein